VRNVKPAQASMSARLAGSLASAMYASRGYVAEQGMPRTIAEVVQHRLVGYESRVSYYQSLRFLEEHPQRVVLRVSDGAALLAAVQAGVGLGVLPCVLGDGAGLERVACCGAPTERIYLVTATELRRTRAVRAVLDFLVDVWRRNARRLAPPERRAP
jgi:DNA-binding transcriptional LysR family regulator